MLEICRPLAELRRFWICWVWDWSGTTVVMKELGYPLAGVEVVGGLWVALLMSNIRGGGVFWSERLVKCPV